MANFAQKFKNMWNPPEDEFDYEEGETTREETASAPAAEEAPIQDTYEDIDSQAYDTQTYEEPSHRSSNVMNFSSSGSGNVQVILFKPMEYRDVQDIAEELVHANTVVLNMEVTPKEIARRVLDFLGGVAYAKDGKVQRVSTNTYIITPHNVDLIGTDAEADSEEEF